MSNESPSLFLSAERADALAAWRSSEPNVLSLHLPIDSAGAYPAALDRLIRESLEADPLLKSVARDIELATRFVRGRFSPGGRRGLCVFSCAKYGVFDAFAAPEPFNASLAVAERPVLGPLSALRRQYRRFLALLAGPERARFVEIHLQESVVLEERDGDFAGEGARELAARAEELRRRRRADRFVLGGAAEIAAALEPQLTPELREGLIVEPLLGPERPNEAVAERVAHNEREARKVRETVLVQRFLDELAAGAAVAGLEAVTGSLQQGAARLLLVRDGWAKMGRCCQGCGRLSVDHRSCPFCFRATTPVLDLVAELTDRAAAAGIEVFRVGDDPRFEAVGRIGACLATPSPRKAEVPESRALRGLFATKAGRDAILKPRFA